MDENQGINVRSYLVWSSRNLVIIVASMVLLATMQWWLALVYGGLDLVIAYVIMFFFLLLLFVGNIDTFLTKIGIWKDINRIVTICKDLKRDDEPPVPLVGSLNTLRLKLVSLAGWGKWMMPLPDYYQSQLRRRINVLFSCIVDTLFREYYANEKASKVPLSGRASFLVREMATNQGTELTTSSKRYDYARLSEWMTSLSRRLVEDRKFFETYSVRLGTMKYFLDDEIELFQSRYQATYEEYKKTVDSFYDRVEQSARERKSVILQFILTLLLAMLAAFVGYYLR